MSPTSRRAWQAHATLLLVAALSFPARAFFPTAWKENIFGGGGVSHIEQTNQAFQTLATRYFPSIDHLSKTMIKARDTISQANADVDDDQNQSALHCDGENFDGVQTRLQQLHGKVISQLNEKDVEAARKSLGSALHTVQDFYAHSNYVELGHTGPSDVLGRTAALQHAGPNDRTCTDCPLVIVPGNGLEPPVIAQCPDCTQNEAGFTQLTSGYYFGEDSPADGAPIPDFKCHHGGSTDHPLGSKLGFILGAPSPGINKDSLSCTFSPHYFAHSAAVSLSISATIQYIEDIKNEITPSQLRQLFGVGSTLAFCIDTTGSMEDIIAGVLEASIDIVTGLLGTPDEPSSYVISPFNDPDTGPVTETSDFNVFKSTIQSLTAEGGGDCPELALHGILAAVNVVDDGSDIFMFTDAAPKDADLETSVINVATLRGIRISSFKFFSDCEDDTPTKRSDSTADDVYDVIALATSGQYYSLPRAQVNNISGIIGTLTSSDSSFVLRIDQLVAPNNTMAYSIPVDSLMTELSFSLRGDGANVTIYYPDKSALDITASGVTNQILSDGQFITVKSPQAGLWSVNVSTSSNYTLDVTGKSSLHFSSFVFSELGGRPGHTGFYPITGSPPYNAEIAIVAGIDGNFSTAEFEFRAPVGSSIDTVPMTAGNGTFGYPPVNSFFTVLQLSPGDRYVYVSGLDADGVVYQRVLPELITPIFSNTTFLVANLTTTPVANVSSSAMPSGAPTTLTQNTTRQYGSHHWSDWSSRTPCSSSWKV